MQQLGKLTLCCQLQAVILADVGLAPGAPGMPPPKFFIGGGHFFLNHVKMLKGQIHQADFAYSIQKKEKY